MLGSYGNEFIKTIDMNGNNTYSWFAILYFISHFITQNPESMKIIHLAISTVSVFLILKYAPFNKIIRAMLVFGYFFFYEYSIISRILSFFHCFRYSPSRMLS